MKDSTGHKILRWFGKKTSTKVTALPISNIPEPSQKTSSHVYERVDLYVPFEQKERAKQLGAKWDSSRKVWFVPKGINPSPFLEWRPLLSQFNIRSLGYFTGEAPYTCSCGCANIVCCFVLPSFHETSEPADEEDAGFVNGSDFDGSAFFDWLNSPAAYYWEKHYSMSLVIDISLLEPDIIQRALAINKGYRVDRTKRASPTWMNHCKACDRAVDDIQLRSICTTIDGRISPLVRLKYFSEPFSCGGDLFALHDKG